MASSRESAFIDAVEQAYDLRPERSEKEWLVDLMVRLRPLIDHGMGMCAFVTDAERPFEELASLDAPAGWDVAMHALLTSADGHRLRAARNSGRTASQGIGARAFRVNEAMRTRWHPMGVRDGIGVTATDGDGRVLTFAAPMDHVGSAPAALSRRLGLIGAHIAAGWRLRRVVVGLSASEREEEPAVLDPSGKILHAIGDARDPAARQKLRAAAVAIDRARGRLRRSDADEALDLWRVLVDGEWSLVDRFDSDGRRFLIAHRNPPDIRDPRALTQRERQVVTLAALGHSLKLVGYELGISASAASLARSAAMRKLGITSLADLAPLVRALQPPPPR
jgi:DNA-binding CsgD family transcriptional regulator